MWRNLKVGVRLTIGFSTLFVFMAAVGIFAILKIQMMEESIREIAEQDMVEVEQANAVIDNINVIARGLRNLLLNEDKKFQENELNRIVESRKNVGELMGSLGKSLTEPEGAAILKQVGDARAVYVKATEDLMTRVRAGQMDEAKKMLFAEVRESQANYFKHTEALIEYKSNESRAEARHMADEADRDAKVISGILVLSVVVSALMAFFTVRSITGPVRKASELAETMARGDFTSKLDVDQKDEIGLMAASLNSMAGQLAAMIRNIIGGVNTLTSSSNDLAGVSRQLSSSARDTAGKAATVATATEEMSSNFHSVTAAMEQSSSNVQMVAAAAEEMAATVAEIAQNTDKARSVSEAAVLQSRHASEKMVALGESTRKIGRVTEMISEISEQTNLLALNATIEAARAGEAGKGFAVVANEIKELARQTSTATGDIRSQIEEMQSTAGTSMKDIENIAAVIAEINAIITGIATAVEEQSTSTNDIAGNISQASQGIAEVNENVAQASSVVADITRDVASINQQSGQVGEGSAQVQDSAQGLAALAVQLERLVKQFKV